MGGPSRKETEDRDLQSGPGTGLTASLGKVMMSESSPGSGEARRKRLTMEKSDSGGREEPKLVQEPEQQEDEENIRALFREMKKEADKLKREGRECPVPKPRGKIGELLGFGRDGRRGRADDEG